MRTVWILLLFGSLIIYQFLTPVSGEGVPSTEPKPSFDQCKPYVDAALKTGSSPQESSSSSKANVQASPEDSDENNKTDETTEDDDEADSKEDGKGEDDDDSKEDGKDGSDENDDDSKEDGEDSKEVKTDDGVESKEDDDNKTGEDDKDSDEKEDDNDDEASKEKEESGESKEGEDTAEEGKSDESDETKAEDEAATDGDSDKDTGEEDKPDGTTSDTVADQTDKSESAESKEEQETQEDQDSSEDASNPEAKADVSDSDEKDDDKSDEDKDDGKSDEDDSKEKSDEDGKSDEDDKNDSDEKSGEAEKSDEKSEEKDEKSGEDDDKSGEDDEKSGESDEDDDSEEDGEVEQYIPRSRQHVTEILGLDDSERTKTTFTLLDQATQITLKELKRIYENAIHPLEKLYKYRDLSNRHFGDPEIFSKPLIVFMGPWSGGKSTIINWLLDIQHEEGALRTGADPSPAQFNIMMHGKEEEILDGTQLAADWTFSGLQKFGQSFLDRLRGRKMPNRLLEKVNIVEIPGILEVRKQVERSFPFNDACQWFIDRADVLFLVYDPAKLDIGPETEAILDQLKGRENQVRIILNKADTVTPEELLRVQAILIWNISPLMSSAEPPVMYAASLWDRPLQSDSPKSLLTAHENHFLKDIRDGIEKQVETRIAAARRFAVRVRNHAKMVDCYLSTYHNHRSFFSDKKKVSTDIIDHPQNYHIYEGLSTLTNISRYDLPDPDTYKDFFKLNHLWDFPTLSSTCSYFRGCPINKVDIAIAYELPELLGKFRRQREAILTAQAQKASNPK